VCLHCPVFEERLAYFYLGCVIWDLGFADEARVDKSQIRNPNSQILISLSSNKGRNIQIFFGASLLGVKLDRRRTAVCGDLSFHHTRLRHLCLNRTVETGRDNGHFDLVIHSMLDDIAPYDISIVIRLAFDHADRVLDLAKRHILAAGNIDQRIGADLRGISAGGARCRPRSQIDRDGRRRMGIARLRAGQSGIECRLGQRVGGDLVVAAAALEGIADARLDLDIQRVVLAGGTESGGCLGVG